MFKKKYMIIALIGMLPLSAMAAGDNVGGCGWGSKVFNGKHGLMPNALAAIANSLFSINTFGMSSGTMGCSADGVVRSNWKTAMFIDGNKPKLAQDMSTGGGETLESLANLMGVQEQHKTAFFQITKTTLPGFLLPITRPPTRW